MDRTVDKADRLERIRARLGAGIYDELAEELGEWLAWSPDSALLDDFMRIPVGQRYGNVYRDKGGELLAQNLGCVLDWTRHTKEPRVAGRKLDLEVPLRLERINCFPPWPVWAARYDIRAVVVEFKNLKSPATSGHVGQLAHYLTIAKRGRFGILVSRNGVTADAMDTMREHYEKDMLIIHLCHSDFKTLNDVATNPFRVMQFFAERERDLLAPEPRAA